jgi:uroporphyrinogen decarboxylase
MNYRERYLETARFGNPDRAFLVPQWFWNETILRWQKEGMPADVHIVHYFGFDRYEVVPINLGLVPPFEVETLEVDEAERTAVIRASDGSIQKIFLDKPELSMPLWLDYPIKTREDWEEYKKRLNPKSPCRYPAWWDDYKRSVKDRDYPLGISVGSFYGWVRNWMGVERLSYMLYDDPNFIREIDEYIADFVIEVTRKAVEELDLDFALFWEDLGMKVGPLISPKHFREIMLPCYKRVTEFLRKNGIDIIWVDSDGNNDPIIPLWLEGGVNGIYPLEVAADQDAVALRKKYGKDLLLMGNIDKRVLARTKEEIEREVLKKVPWLAMQGGYFPFVDHSVPPDVPLENFQYYLDLVKQAISDPERYYHLAREKGYVEE